MEEDYTRQKYLLQRVSQGDQEAFRLVFEYYKDRFYAVALSTTRSQEESAEIVQEVFVSLWEHRTILNKVESPSSYLFGIVYHHINQHFKKIISERKFKQKLSELTVDSESLTENILIEKEHRQRLHDIIGQLPPQQQLIYQLSKQDGYSRDEIARELHISPNTVKNHLLRALKFIRAHFGRALFMAIALFC